MIDSLDGLSVGDALGQQFPVMRRSLSDLRSGNLPTGPWGWTDDTEMACSVAAELGTRGAIDPDLLATAFARRCDPARDYGFHSVGILRRIREGVPWPEASGSVYEGQGSCGNGAAMRVAPLGAFYAGDPDRIVAEATRSARVTHMHPEGVAGAVAVALAAGEAGRARSTGVRPAPGEFLTAVLGHLADGETARSVGRARTLLGASVEHAAAELGNGSRVTAQNTVPFTMWAAATYLDNYPAAITACIEADGDIDTTSAIVGGIVATYTGKDSLAGLPATWLAAREPLPRWLDPAHFAYGRPKSRFGWLHRWVTGTR
ncbi:ADP-ribosylglycohydrolase family protein [Nocardia flavorosea]|uniref:ADP-ribosylglycohydrolase family protein n=2 Tax=Nocardia flavorosea TaxID=53429 RepID=A0A846YAN4_9NOCA|nr:ADP-ribosylglycohydrolase family protein [Nocardia flavorosea]